MVVGLVPGLIVSAWFAYRGALHDLISVRLLYNLQVYSQNKPLRVSRDFKAVLTFFSTGPVVWALPLIVAGGYLLVRGQKGASELPTNPVGRCALKPAPSGSSALIVPRG